MTAPQAALSRGISALLDLMAAAVMFALMALTCVDVIGRYVFNAPVRGGLELIEIMMVLLVFAGLPLVTANREHVTVDMVPVSAQRWLRRLHLAAVDAIGVICLSVATWQLWVRGARAIALGDVTSQLRLPIGAVIYLMSALTAVAVLALATRLVAGQSPAKDQ